MKIIHIAAPAFVIGFQPDIELQITFAGQIRVADNLGESTLQNAQKHAVGVVLGQRRRSLGIGHAARQGPFLVQFQFIGQ